jgi:hypothetical protein
VVDEKEVGQVKIPKTIGVRFWLCSRIGVALLAQLIRAKLAN